MSTQSPLGSPREDPLVMIVEASGDGRDRCTVYPRDVPEVDRTTTWLTVNADVLADLAEHR